MHSKKTTTKRVLVITLKTLGIAFALFLAAWMGIAIYVNYNKTAILASITNQLNENINGTLTVEMMEPTLVKGFPAISVSLKNVTLRDTMYYKHQHDLLKAKNISITVDAFSILKSAPRIRDIHVEDGSIYLFTDSFGYSNTNIFIEKEIRDSSGKRPPPKFNHFFFDNVDFVFEHKANKKLFHFEVKHFEGKFDYKSSGWQAFAKLDVLVKALDFYNPNGPFLKNKRVVANLNLNYNADKQIFNIPFKEIEINNDNVSIGAKVLLGNNPVVYQIDIAAKQIGFQNGRTMLSDHIQGKVGMVNLKKPLDIQVTVTGKDQRRDEPVVYARWQVKNNTLEGQGAQIKDCSFTGYFLNRVNPALPVGDLNSVIAVNSFSGNWEKIDFTADSIRIDNLISPVLAGHFQSSFPLEKLNPVLNISSFKMEKGEVNLDLRFKGGIKNNDSVSPFIMGDVVLKNAAMTYVPRQLSFTNTQAELNFRGTDLFIKNIRVQNGANVLNMDGHMENLLQFFYTDPEKILLRWHMRSNQLNLNQYKTFLVARNKSVAINLPAPPKKSGSINRLSGQLDQILEKSSVLLEMELGKVIYQKFTAENIKAIVRLNQSGIELNKVSLVHAGGKLNLDGRINQNGPTNEFNVNAVVEKVKVDDFLLAFGNFGQSTVTDRNIRGEIYLKAAVTGALKDDGMLVPHSMKGNVEFELTNGVLLNFEPLKNVGKYVFRRRDFSNISILSLKDKLDINGEQIYIHPLKFSSDVINADIEGIYSFSKGTDINVDIPLRNPQKDELILDEEIKEKNRNKGIVIHLNASDKEDGSMKISLKGKAAAPRSNQIGPEDPSKRKKRRSIISF